MRLLSAMLLLGCAHAQLLPDLAPDLPDAEPIDALPSQDQAAGLGPVAGGEVLIPRLQAIHLLGPAGAATEQISAGIFRCPDLLLPSPRTLASRLDDWLGQALTDQGLGALGDLILAHYDGEGFPVVLVDAPEQDLSTGKLEILIEVGTIGRVGLSRPKFGDPEILRRGLSLRTGEMLRRGALEEQLDWYGRTPFRRPRLFVSPGLTPASADLLIGIEERRPWRVYLGYEDSGPDLLGHDRFRIGFVGMTPNEHLIGWQSAVGAPISSLHGHALHWEIPFHRLHHRLRLDAAFAKVESRYLSGGIPVQNDGTSWAFTSLYQMPLPSGGGWRQQLAVGTEIKGTDQFLLFGGGPISPGDVLLIHGKIEYQLTRSWEDAGLSLLATVLAAPGGLSSKNSDDAFRAYDPLAESSYLVGRIGGDAWWSPGADWQLRARVTGQCADGRLLPAEQFAAGGYATVRGVSERLVLADTGWHGSFELLSPRIRPLKGLDLRLLAFFDYAWLKDRGGPSQSLAGTGLGLRMRVAENVDIRLDHGWRVDHRGDRSHVGLVVSY